MHDVIDVSPRHSRQTKSCAACLLAGVVLLAGAMPIHAASLPGKAPPSSVVPAGPRNPHTGAPIQWDQPMQDDALHQYSSIDRAEYGTGDGPDNYAWEASGWFGGDIHRLWWKTEGEGPTHGGGPDATVFQASYGRAITPFWNALGGLRYDINPGNDRVFGLLKLQGLAPLFIDTETSLFISEDGQISARGEFEYQALLTQRLRLAPRAEINLGVRDTDYGLGSGLQNTQLGLRLKYQVIREFTPYIGVRWEQSYGDTRDITRREGEASSSTAFVAGFSAWY